LIDAIEHEVQRHQVSDQRPDFWESVEKLRARMKEEGTEIDPDEIWGDVRDRSSGRRKADSGKSDRSSQADEGDRIAHTSA
jgi:hypothetical protein